MKFFRYCQLILSLFRSEDENRPQRRKRGNRRTTRQRLVPPDRSQVDKTPDTPKIREKEKQDRIRHNLKLVGRVAMGMVAVTVVFIAVRETVVANPRFYVHEIFVDPGKGDGMLTPTQIKSASGLKEGMNLLTVNLRDVGARLRQLPAISDVNVVHDFAGKITITPTQRTPVAWVKCEHLHWVPKRVGQGLVVDADGLAIPAETMLSGYENLPVITDDTIDQITAGAPIVSVRFVAAMNLMKQLQAREQADHRSLKGITVANRYALNAAFDDGSMITFSYDDYESELKRYDQFLVTARNRQWQVSSLNLVAEFNTPVTLKVASNTTTTPEAPAIKAEPVRVTPPPVKKKTSSSNTSARSTKKTSKSKH